MAATSKTTRTGIFIADFLYEKYLAAPGDRIKSKCERLSKSFVEARIAQKEIRTRCSERLGTGFGAVGISRVLPVARSGRDGRDDQFAEQADTHGDLGRVLIARDVFIIVFGVIRGRRSVVCLVSGGQVFVVGKWHLSCSSGIGCFMLLHASRYTLCPIIQLRFIVDRRKWKSLAPGAAALCREKHSDTKALPGETLTIHR